MRHRSRGDARVGGVRALGSVVSFLAALCSTPAVVAADAAPVTRECIREAAEYHEVPVEAIVAILATERGQVGQIVANGNGTVDIGPMQINSLWLERFAEHGIHPEALRYDGCTNVYAGAWILARHVRATSSVVDAIGRYHSRTDDVQRDYLRSLIERAQTTGSLSTLLEEINGGDGAR